MSKFSSGQKVICVKPNEHLGLKAGKVYTVRHYFYDHFEWLLTLEEFPPIREFLAFRFEPCSPYQELDALPVEVK